MSIGHTHKPTDSFLALIFSVQAKGLQLSYLLNLMKDLMTTYTLYVYQDRKS